MGLRRRSPDEAAGKLAAAVNILNAGMTGEQVAKLWCPP